MSITVFTDTSHLWDYLAGTEGDDLLVLENGQVNVSGWTGTDALVLDSPAAQVHLLPWTYLTPCLWIEHPGGRARVWTVEILQLADITLQVSIGPEDLAADLRGTSVNDLLVGYHRRDVMLGRAGDDWLISGDGADRMRGGAGNDRINAGGDNDSVRGGDGADILRGETGNDRIHGGDGRDRLFGGEGGDLLEGGAHRDVLKGGSGDDQLAGQTGNDVLTGSAGADIFRFHKGDGNDRITDFELGLDHIQIVGGPLRLSRIDFEQQGDDTLVRFANVRILVENVALDALCDADNFQLL